MARVMGKEELRIDISSLAQDGHEIETGTSPEQMSPVDLLSGRLIILFLFRSLMNLFHFY